MNQDADGLESEVALLLDACGPAVALERVARGGGMTRWWLVRTTTDFRIAYQAARPGSRVHVLPLGSDLAYEPLEAAVPGIQTVAQQATEVVFGTLKPGETEFDVQLLDRSELAEALAAVGPNEWVLYGTFPATEGEPPGIQFTPPDADGVVRPQPV